MGDTISRKAQLSIDYTSGALLFFLSMIFVVTGALSIVPQYDSFAQTNSVETTAWKLSTLLMNEPGHWRSAQGGGNDWQTQVDRPERIDMIGLATPEGRLSRQKILALSSINYTFLKTKIFRTEKDFSFVFTEYMPIDTGRTFTKQTGSRSGTPPSSLAPRFTPPFEPTSYDDADQEVHYGSKQINGAVRYFLVTSDEGVHDEVYISDSWNFSDATNVSSGERTILTFNGRRYALEVSGSGVTESEGAVVVLERTMDRFGQQPPAAQEQVTRVTRYANMGTAFVKMTMRLWG